jgi:hypothetical protein
MQHLLAIGGAVLLIWPDNLNNSGDHYRQIG